MRHCPAEELNFLAELMKSMSCCSASTSFSNMMRILTGVRSRCTRGRVAEDVVGFLALEDAAADAHLRQPADVVIGATQNAHHVFAHDFVLLQLQAGRAERACRLQNDGFFVVHLEHGLGD